VWCQAYFSVVALAHLLRIVYGMSIQIDDFVKTLEAFAAEPGPNLIEAVL
jgi:hypothetical protein